MKLSDAVKIYAGANEAAKAYLGTEEVWAPSGGGGYQDETLAYQVYIEGLGGTIVSLDDIDQRYVWAKTNGLYNNVKQWFLSQAGYKDNGIRASDILCIGTTSTGSDSGYNGYIYYYRVQAIASENVSVIRVYGTANTNDRVAIYSDKTGPLPNVLLGESASTPVLANQWNDISIPNVAVVNGLYYWIAIQTQAIGGFNTFSHAGDQAETYSYGAFPVTANPFANAWGLCAGGYNVTHGSGGTVAPLFDLSSNHYDGIQTADSKRPIWMADKQNGKAGIVFAASASQILSHSYEGIGPHTLVVVGRGTTAQTGQRPLYETSHAGVLMGIWARDASAGVWGYCGFNSSYAVYDAWHILIHDNDGNNGNPSVSKFYTDNHAVETITNTSRYSDGYERRYIGGSPIDDNAYVNAEIGEIIAFNTQLSSGQIASLKTLLNSQWAIY